MYKIIFLFFMVVDLVFATSTSDAILLRNITILSPGSTKVGTALEAFAFNFEGEEIHEHQCVKYCDMSKVKDAANFAYDICASSNEDNIFERLSTSPITGVKCMLYCNRFDLGHNSIHHKEFIDQFLSYFLPTKGLPTKDADTTSMLAAVMSVAPGNNIRNSVLHRYLTYHKYSTTNYSTEKLDDRLLAVLKMLKDYHCKDLAEKKVTGILFDPRDEVGCNK